MPKDIKTKDGQKSLLSNYLDDLLLNINESYGPVLLKELQSRLESTINEFNDEINEAFGLLKKRNDDRKALYANSNNNSDLDVLNEESAWEKKLKEIDKKN